MRDLQCIDCLVRTCFDITPIVFSSAWKAIGQPDGKIDLAFPQPKLFKYGTGFREKSAPVCRSLIKVSRFENRLSKFDTFEAGNLRNFEPFELETY
jgi:hypothetical protein